MARRPLNLSPPTEPTWPTLPLVGFRRNLRMTRDQIAVCGLPGNEDRPGGPAPDRFSPLGPTSGLPGPAPWPVRGESNPDGRAWRTLRERPL